MIIILNWIITVLCELFKFQYIKIADDVKWLELNPEDYICYMIARNQYRFEDVLRKVQIESKRGQIVAECERDDGRVVDGAEIGQEAGHTELVA